MGSFALFIDPSCARLKFPLKCVGVIYHQVTDGGGRLLDGSPNSR